MLASFSFPMIRCEIQNVVLNYQRRGKINVQSLLDHLESSKHGELVNNRCVNKSL
jgi:hypothetical protein